MNVHTHQVSSTSYVHLMTMDQNGDMEFTRFNGQIVKQHSLTQMLLG